MEDRQRGIFRRFSTLLEVAANQSEAPAFNFCFQIKIKDILFHGETTAKSSYLLMVECAPLV